jgi:hypothetical protein
MRTPTIGLSAENLLSYALALAAAVTVCHGRAAAQNAINDGGSGASFLLGRGEHVSYESKDVRVDAAPELYQSTTTVVAEASLVGASRGALVINATFDSSITNDPNAAAIQTMINNAVSIYQSLFNDPITVSIRFRYSTTYPNGTPLPSGCAAVSDSVLYTVGWNTYINALHADATTANDATANASLPASARSTNVRPASADGRAVGLKTPPAMFADGSVGSGGPYDGIVTLNSNQSFKFTRPPATGFSDALRATEHEIDEVLGFGSYLNAGGSDLRPQDLFSWSAAGVRNLMASGSRYFSIDGGVTSIVGFNQDPMGDFDDWLSGSCPQANPYVQNAFGCSDQASDVTATSPEGINLDVIGYDLITAAPSSTNTPTATPTNTPTGSPTSTPTVTRTLNAALTATPSNTRTFTATPSQTLTLTPTNTATPTPTVTPTPTPPPTPPPGPCVGDCDDSGTVTISEVIQLVNFALGTSTDCSTCPNGIPGDVTCPSGVSVSVIIRAVNIALGASACTS